MRIGIAQIRAEQGAVERNVAQHKKLITLAVANGADALVFPELSLTAYEPALARELAFNPEDRRLKSLQTISNANQLTIGVGLPLLIDGALSIGMLIFQPFRSRQVYLKSHLHPDEQPFFTPKPNTNIFLGRHQHIAPAICYELSVPEHIERAARAGATCYLAGVAKYHRNIGAARDRLAWIAQRYQMTVLMANAVGWADGEECAGRSSIWNPQGRLIGQMKAGEEGVMILDETTQEVLIKTL